MRTIPLTQGKVAIVDDEDYEELSKHKWYATEKYGKWYAVRHLPRQRRKQKAIQMHRKIIGFPEGKDIDHINHNGLDNRRANLRICTRSQNKKNSLGYKNNSSGLNGVSWHKRDKRWEANIRKGGRLIHLGYFNDKDQAGRAVDKKAKELFGDFSILNFPEENGGKS